MSAGEQSGPGKRNRHQRGTFERSAGSGGLVGPLPRRERAAPPEKVGPKSLAGKVYQKRKNEVQARRFFPGRIGRGDVLLAEMIDDCQTGETPIDVHN